MADRVTPTDKSSGARADLKDLEPEEALGRLYENAVAGASDEWLAQQADVSVAMVRRWKRRVGLEQAQVQKDALRGKAQVAALRGLVSSYEPARHRTAEHLDFTTPAFVLRDPLDYTQYARAVFMLHQALSFSLEQIANATGTRRSDVETALGAYRRHLGKKGKPCLGCAMLLDDRFGDFCSKACHDRALTRRP